MEYADLTAKLLGPLVTLLGILIGVLGWQNWKKQLRSTRELDIAENTLSLFLEACHYIAIARTRNVSEDEERLRPKFKDEPDTLRLSLKTILAMAYAPILRFEKQKDFWQKFEVSKYKFIVNFAQENLDVEEFYLRILDIKRNITWSAQHYIEQKIRMENPDYRKMMLNEDETSQQVEEWLKQNQKTIWQSIEETDDEINIKLDKIITDLENVCLPAIRLSKKI